MTHLIPEKFKSVDKAATNRSVTVGDIISVWVRNNLGLTDLNDMHAKILTIEDAFTRSNTENILFPYTGVERLCVSERYIRFTYLSIFVSVEHIEYNDKFKISFNRNNIIEEIEV